MNFSIKDGKVSFDLLEALSTMTGEQRLTLIQALSCMDEVITEVTNQIVDGFTSDGWRAGRFCAMQAEPFHGLDAAVRRVALCAGDVAKAEIEGLQRELKRKEEEIARMYQTWEPIRNREARF